MVDLLVYSIPLLVAHEAGMTSVVKDGLDLLANISFYFVYFTYFIKQHLIYNK